MMRFVIRSCLIVAIVLAGGVSYYLYKHDLPFSWAGIQTSLQAASNSIHNLTAGSSESETVIYKHQDENGVWQYSNRPSATPDSETSVYRSDTNVLPNVAPKSNEQN